MKKIRILASQFARDVKSGANDSLLMERYGLSVRSLLKVKTELVKQGLLSVEDVESLHPGSAPSRMPIRSKEFLESFSKNPDDFHLMAEYSLSPGQLKKIYETLIKKGLLSEYEFTTRTGKAPEIGDGNYFDREDSTSISWKPEPIDTRGDSTEIRKFLLSLADEAGSYSRTADQSREGLGREAENRGPATKNPGSCPKCGHPKDPSMPESCSLCGIVYAKVGKNTRRDRISVWEESVEIR